MAPEAPANGQAKSCEGVLDVQLSASVVLAASPLVRRCPLSATLGLRTATALAGTALMVASTGSARFGTFSRAVSAAAVTCARQRPLPQQKL